MFERLMAMQIADEEGYQQYRDAMRPVLKEFGGGFRFDCRVSAVLSGELDHPVNRIFIIYFPDEQAGRDFFADPRYLEIRSADFDRSVSGATELAAYTR